MDNPFRRNLAVDLVSPLSNTQISLSRGRIL